MLFIVAGVSITVLKTLSSSKPKMAAKHTYTKTSTASASAKAIYVGAEFDAEKLCLNGTDGLYATFNGSIIGHIAPEAMGLPDIGVEYFKKGMLHQKFKKPFKVRVINLESTVKLIGTGKQMYDLQVI